MGTLAEVTSSKRLHLGAGIVMLLASLTAALGCAGRQPQPATVAAKTAAPELTQGSTTGPGETAVSEAQKAAAPASFTGMWQGTSTALCLPVGPGFGFNTRCHAINRIMLTLVQRDSKVEGGYRCDFGNMNCRNMNDTGKITGSASGNRLQIRIFLPDGTSCLFRGLRKGKLMAGAYTCYAGGGILEQGNFNVQWMY